MEWNIRREMQWGMHRYIHCDNQAIMPHANTKEIQQEKRQWIKRKEETDKQIENVEKKTEA